ncbi:MFS transporter [Ktedonosporobacter rubrisoli]|uniref:MFS transporter n=1 Tax=Ktedonosporobacter rubrisoli TaxID=2509675 RepID=A0A4P6K3S9_KTERU|nr:MFS transporter [Ktedonosporobacter rubrisoli]QBD82928.1 MFS transporter [Ktedonosporobacter rubrisoli]
MDTTVSVSAEPEKKPPTLFERLLINRNYAFMWVGMATSRLGNVVFDTALLLWVATTLARNAPWSAFAVGALIFIPQIVALLMGTFAGVLVDRWDKRRTLLWMDGARIFIVLALIPASGLFHLPFPSGSDIATFFQMGCAFFILILLGCCDPFVNPALLILLYDIVPEDDLPRAFGRGQVLNNLGTIVGPPLAAGIFFTLGIQWCIFFNAASFLVSFLNFMLIRPERNAQKEEVKAEQGAKEEKKAGFVHELVEGLRFVGGNGVLIAVGVSLSLIALGAGGLNTLNLFFATDNLHATPDIYVYLDVLYGIGAIIGALTVGPWVQKKLGVMSGFCIPGIVTGLLLFTYARLDNVYAGFIVLFFVGVSQATFYVSFGPLLLKVTPRKLIGRANAVIGQLSTFAGMISIGLASVLVTSPLHNKHLTLPGFTLGPIDTIFMVVGLLALTSGIQAMATFNDYKLVDKQEETPAEKSSENEDVSQPLISYVGRPGWLSTKKRQAAICLVGFLVCLLIILPVAFIAPSSTAATVTMSYGHPATGETIEGMECASTVATRQQLRTHLTLYVNGHMAALPTGIGIVSPKQPGVRALASNGNLYCLYPLHVFEADNIIHADLPDTRTYTLGQFFSVWGQPLSRTQIADYKADAGKQLKFVVFDGKGNEINYTGDPGALSLEEHKTIVVLYNSPDVHPTPFTDWNGL